MTVICYCFHNGSFPFLTTYKLLIMWWYLLLQTINFHLHTFAWKLLISDLITIILPCRDRLHNEFERWNAERSVTPKRKTTSKWKSKQWIKNKNYSPLNNWRLAGIAWLKCNRRLHPFPRGESIQQNPEEIKWSLRMDGRDDIYSRGNMAILTVAKPLRLCCEIDTLHYTHAHTQPHARAHVLTRHEITHYFYESSLHG